MHSGMASLQTSIPVSTPGFDDLLAVSGFRCYVCDAATIIRHNDTQEQHFTSNSTKNT